MTYGLRRIGGVLAEVCDECGFDSRGCREVASEIRVTLGALDRLSRHPRASRRPAEDIWSGQEYCSHSAEVVGFYLGEIAAAAGLPSQVPPQDCPAAATALDDVLARITTEQLATLAIDVGTLKFSVQTCLAHVLHDLGHHELDVRKGYAALALADGEEILTVR